MENNGDAEVIYIPKEAIEMYKRKISRSINGTCFIKTSSIKHYWTGINEDTRRGLNKTKYKLIENPFGYLYFKYGEVNVFIEEKVNDELIEKVLNNLKKKQYWNKEKMEALIKLIPEEDLENWCYEFGINGDSDDDE